MNKAQRDFTREFINKAHDKAVHRTDSSFRDLQILSENYATAQEEFLTFFLDYAPNDLPSDLYAQMLMTMAQIHNHINGTNDERYLQESHTAPCNCDEKCVC